MQPLGSRREIQAQLEKESDRGATLLVAELLRALLQQRLLEHLPEPRVVEEGLRDPNSALGGLSTLLRLCRGLRLLTDGQYRRLLLLRQLRNDFAHHWTAVDFTTPSIDRINRKFTGEANAGRKGFEAQAMELLQALGLPENPGEG